MCKIGDGIVLLFLLLCSLTDVRTKKISLRLLIGMSVAMICLRLLQQDFKIVSTAGGLFCGGIFCLISRFTGEAIGYGDSWIILLLGLYLGFEKQLTLLMIAFLCAGLFALIGLLRQKWSQTASIPFVPFLTAAYIGVWFV